ncbi:hypothetical protein ACMD2_22163, partial [Ananas comosus]
MFLISKPFVTCTSHFPFPLLLLLLLLRRSHSNSSPCTPPTCFEESKTQLDSTSGMLLLISPEGMSSLDMAGCNVGAGAEAAAAAAAAAEASRFSFPRAVHLENWGDSAMAVTSPITDTSTDVDNDDRNQI